MNDYGVKIPKGQITYNTVGASAGILSLLNQSNNGCGNGLLGGILGGNNNGNCHVTEKEAALSSKIAFLEAKNQAAEAGTKAFTDSVTFTSGEVNKINANLKTVFDTVVTQGVAIQRVSDGLECFQKIEDKNKEIMALQLDAIRKDIKIEADKRCCGDNSIVTYSNATFYPKQVANIQTANTSVPQPTYNPLPNCGCSCD